MAKRAQPTLAEVARSIAQSLRVSATRPNIYGYKPHEKQIEFHKAIQKQRLFIGGNRSGKTVGGATEAIWWATGTHPYRKTPEPPVRLRGISVDFLNGVDKIMRPEIAKWIPPSALKNGSWTDSYDREHKTLEFANESFIEFMSYDQDLDAFAGTSRHGIWFDEEPPQDVFGENKLRLLDVGGEWWMTMTPVEGMTWIYDDIYLPGITGENSRIFVIEVNTEQNVYLPRLEIEDLMADLSEEDIEVRIKGKFIQRAGLIYKSFDAKKNVIPLSTSSPIYIPPKEWLWVAGLDHGLHNPTAWLWAAISPDGRIEIFHEHYESERLVGYHAERVHEINRYFDREPDYYVGDPSIRNREAVQGTSVHLEYLDYGIPIVLGNNDVAAGINRVARYITGGTYLDENEEEVSQSRLYITQNCTNLLWEIQRYSWATWANRKMDRQKNKKEEPNKKNDHAVDALRYIVASRPEMDTGKYVPRWDFNQVEASVAVNPHNRVDEGLSRLSLPKRLHVDDVLGSDF